MHLTNGLIINDYIVVDFLGQGSSAYVYKIKKNDEYFALKILADLHKSDHSSQSKIIRFRREASFIARLKSESVVKIYDSGEYNKSPYIICEYIEGETCEHTLKQSGKFSEIYGVALLKSMALALKEMHDLQMIHKDIKPENIMVSKLNGDSVVFKLLDLGLAGHDFIGSLPSDQEEQGKKFVGTLFYSSPEQAGLLKRPVDNRSDFFSLGVTLYEMLTSQLPFSTINTNQFLLDLSTKNAPLINLINPEISEKFSLIINKLIQKDPDDRYQTADSLLYDLNNLNQIQDLGLKFNNRIRKNTISFVGREIELHQIRKSLDSLNRNSESNKGQAFIILGESGSGKSRLAEEILDLARRNNLQVLSGKCISSFSTTLAFLKEAFEDFYIQFLALDSNSQIELARKFSVASQINQELISKFCLGLNQIIKTDQKLNFNFLKSNENSDQQDQFYKIIREFIIQLSIQLNGLVIKIDDIQWADRETKDFIIELSKDLQKSQILLLMTSRNDSESLKITDEIFLEMNQRLTTQIILKPLEFRAVHTLIKEILGGKNIHESISKKISKISNGNAFVVGEYVRSLLASGDLFIEKNTWTLKNEGFDQLDISKNVYDVIVKRMSYFDQNLKRLICFAALIGNRFKSHSLIEASKMNLVEGYQALQLAQENQFFEAVDEKTHKFVHDKIREALSASLNVDERQSIFDDWVAYFEGKKNINTSSLDSSEYFDLARCYAEGSLSKNYQKAWQAQLEAGQKSNEAFAFDQSYQFLKFAQNISIHCNLSYEQKLIFHDTFGLACTQSGHLDEAHIQYLHAKNMVSSSWEKAKYTQAIAYVYSGEAKSEESWQSTKEALDLLGHSHPKTILASVITLVYLYFVVTFLTTTGLFYGYFKKPNKEKKFKKFQLLFNLYEGSFFTCYYRGHVLDLLHINFRQTYYSHFLGDGPEASKGLIAMSVMYGLFTFQKPMKWYSLKAYKLAEKLNDFHSRAYLLCRDAFGVEFSGDPRSAEKLCLAAMPEAKRYLGSNLCSLTMLDLVYQYIFSGHNQKALEFTLQYSDFMNKTGNYFTLSAMQGINCIIHTISGNVQEVPKYYPHFIHYFENIKNVNFGRAYFYTVHMVMMYETGDLSPKIEEYTDELINLKMEDYHFRLILPWGMYASLEILEKSLGTPEEKNKRKRVKKILRHFRLRAWVPLSKCSYKIGLATLNRINKNYKKALELLAEADELAEKSNSIWAIYNSTLEKARIYRETHMNHKAEIEASSALKMAYRYDWKVRADKVIQEFDLNCSDLQINHSKSSTISSKSNSSTINPRSQFSEGSHHQSPQHLNDRRIIKALMEVSQAFSKSFDLNEQLNIILDCINKVMGSERAYVFTFDESLDQLIFLCGRDSQQSPLLPKSGFSQTVIQLAKESLSPKIIAGTDELKIIGSKSAIASELRSLMAVPLFMGEKLKGIIYVDSRIAKGLFAQSDVEVLSAIGSYILIGLESSKLAQFEIDKKSAEKDLELSSAVQTLFLPKQNHINHSDFNISGYCRPASQCGGDWWWYKHIEHKHKLYGAIADVTGHGPGPAMITASISTTFSVIGLIDQEFDMVKAIQQTNSELFRLTQGQFNMSLFAFEIDLLNSKMKFWSAGHPFPIIQKSDGTFEAIGVVSELLGKSQVSMVQSEIDLSGVEKIIMYTDGLTELSSNGKPFGERRLVNTLKEYKELDSKDLLLETFRKLDKFKRNEDQVDDITLFILELKPKGLDNSLTG